MESRFRRSDIHARARWRASCDDLKGLGRQDHDRKREVGREPGEAGSRSRGTIAKVAGRLGHRGANHTRRVSYTAFRYIGRWGSGYLQTAHPSGFHGPLRSLRLPPLGAAMWLVRIALQRPYTFIVMSLLILVVGALSIIKMPTD